VSSSTKDKIYANKQDKVQDFVFDDTVADVFPDMIQRSVPGYEELNQLIPIVAKQFIQSNSTIYDLGCSLGEASISIAKSLELSNVKIIAIDNSTAMIDRLERIVEDIKLHNKITVKQEDITESEVNNACLVILNYTLQFIDRNKRQQLLSMIASGLM